MRDLGFVRIHVANAFPVSQASTQVALKDHLFLIGVRVKLESPV